MSIYSSVSHDNCQMSEDTLYTHHNNYERFSSKERNQPKKKIKINEDANDTQYHENPNNCIKINKLRFDNDSKITMFNSIFNTKLDSEI